MRWKKGGRRIGGERKGQGICRANHAPMRAKDGGSRKKDEKDYHTQWMANGDWAGRAATAEMGGGSG